MSLFESKFFWCCVLVCIGIAGFLGVNTYKSQARRVPVKVYKTTHPPPVVKSSEKTQVHQGGVDQTQPSVETVDSVETQPSAETVDSVETQLGSVEMFKAEVPTSTPTEEITTQPPETIEPTEDPYLANFSAENFGREMQEAYNMIMNQYPLLSLPESEILKLIETETGARELKRQADGLQADMIRAANKYIPKLSDAEKQQVLEGSRRLLSQYMTHDQIEEHLSQFNW
ncbi:MAG: hypothetical protein OXG97_15420 [Candidatus Poribacteria bacterium]|nr:hypothetical protein [Candidatus Poribacteria bacterium]